MFRSLSFIHLFVILSVGYIGGALLFREVPQIASEKWIGFFDPRVLSISEGAFRMPLITTFLFFLVAFGLSVNNKTRHAVLFIGAVKCVLFGLSSSYLLATGMNMIAYSVWWFPFQLLSCLLFLVYCIVLSPPYFNRISKRQRNLKAIPYLLAFYSIILLIEMTIYNLVVK
ncbi:hypothetical protein H9649_03490 [Sporosarcina sp. Sa2YVA2]|uniref:Uncharacterized protein n=1 Tax=Sporosarcina quadrami TaxID=2762234 RepID=A0ABR8U6I1_9BACL|nr:hypothetical protein [Sporosarcina quadrami]MBD7983636.1 hypothetical protein [Sporosarcina quadrami]